MTTWEHVDSPLARAFTAAIERAEAISDSDYTITEDRQSRGAMLIGTDIDADELQNYVAIIGGAYVGLAVDRLHQLGNRNLARAMHDSDMARKALGETTRGAFVQGVLVGHYHARELGAGAPVPAVDARDATGDPCPECGAPDTPAAARDTSNPAAWLSDVANLTSERRAELQRDGVQYVIDLEADHLERLAPALEAFGLATIAGTIRAAAIALRNTLESV